MGLTNNLGKLSNMITSTGSAVGIGTSSPANVLHVVGGNGNQMDLDNTSQRYTQLNFKNNGTQRAFLATDQTASEFQIYGQAGFALALGAGGGERMRITSGGNVLIGTTSDDASIWRLQVATNADVGLRIKSSAAAYTSRIELAAAGGGASVINAQGGANTLYVSANNTNGVYITSGATSWTGNSDERLKDITGNIENAIDSLMALRTVKHTWKSDENKKEHLALIAQDVEKVFPQVIDKNKLPSKADDENPDETEYLGVRYTELVPVLVKAIQELNERLNKAGL